MSPPVRCKLPSFQDLSKFRVRSVKPHKSSEMKIENIYVINPQLFSRSRCSKHVQIGQWMFARQHARFAWTCTDTCSGRTKAKQSSKNLFPKLSAFLRCPHGFHEPRASATNRNITTCQCIFRSPLVPQETVVWYYSDPSYITPP